MTTTIYRIEHPIDGRGLFRSRFDELDEKYSDAWESIYNLRYDHGKKITVIHRVIENFTQEHFCGFLSLKHILEMFPLRDMKKITDVGFVVVRIKANNVLVGTDNIQVGYKLDDVVKKHNVTKMTMKKLEENTPKKEKKESFSSFLDTAFEE